MGKQIETPASMNKHRVSEIEETNGSKQKNTTTLQIRSDNDQTSGYKSEVFVAFENKLAFCYLAVQYSCKKSLP